jgi:hypothetical protein
MGLQIENPLLLGQTHNNINKVGYNHPEYIKSGYNHPD